VIHNTTDGSRWIRSDPTYPADHRYSLLPPTAVGGFVQILPTHAITDTLLRAGEFELSGGFNVRSPARKLSFQFFPGRPGLGDTTRVYSLFTIHDSRMFYWRHADKSPTPRDKPRGILHN
jgi:hypothetical protein